MRLYGGFCALLLVIAACGSEDGTADVDAGLIPSDDAGADPPGDLDATIVADAALALWQFPSVNGVPNADDDDGNDEADYSQARFAADDDFSIIEFPAELIADLSDTEEVELELLAGDEVHVWLADTLVIDAETPIYRWQPALGDTLAFEFGRYNFFGALAIRRIDNNEVVEQAEIELSAAPAILNHHLQGAEHIWAVKVSAPGFNNSDFIDSFSTELGANFSAVSGPSYGWDIWMQDEHEFATLTGDQGQRLDLIIDSIRDRGLDDFAEDLELEDSTIRSWGTGSASTFDSFGNLEVSPPVSTTAGEYPHGRIYYGRDGGNGLNTILASFLDSQEVQAPFEIDTTWLCVGHVDEFSSFIPDPSAPKGFKLLIADVPAAIDLLEGLPADTEIPRYGDHGYNTVGEILDDFSLRTLNQDIQSDHLDPIREKFKTELGLTDTDIIEVPSLFERACSGSRVAALIPGMVNLTVVDDGSAATKLFIPDPFFRSTLDQATDPLIGEMRSLLPSDLELHFVDDWNVYHLGLGEVHCGTNVRRTPGTQWWQTEGQP